MEPVLLQIASLKQLHLESDCRAEARSSFPQLFPGWGGATMPGAGDIMTMGHNFCIDGT